MGRHAFRLGLEHLIEVRVILWCHHVAFFLRGVAVDEAEQSVFVHAVALIGIDVLELDGLASVLLLLLDLGAQQRLRLGLFRGRLFVELPDLGGDRSISGLDAREERVLRQGFHGGRGIR